LSQTQVLKNMSGIDLRKFARATTMERWPWSVRALLGSSAASVAVLLTYLITPLRAFPLLLGFATVVLVCWYLGMWGGVFCALTDAVLVDRFVTRTQFRFNVGFVPEEIRLTVFLLVSILLGWAIRRLARQRSRLATRKLKQRLTLANAQRQLAEERARASEALRDRDDMLQIALEASGMGLWIWDSQRDIVQWSDEVYRIAGREPGSVAPSTETWLSFVHPEDADAVRTAVMQARVATLYHQQHRVLWPDGTVRWVESQGRSHRDREGHVTRIAGVLADITNRKLSEEAMLRAEKLAVAGRLAASVAHEINNPLEAVANLLYLITHAETTEEAHTLAQQALEELMRVSLITQQTLKFHRQAGVPKITALSEVIQNVLALFRGRLRAAQIEVEVQSEREESIACMPGEIQQIFANLISNAIDAMPHGGRLLIRVQSSRDWRDGRTPGIRVTFLDSGIGMDRATMQRMFEPFFTTKPETGTGLGMWVVAQLVERHHGHVRVWSSQSADASTTAISVFLPASSPLTANPQHLPAAQANA
jgi:PAS domain S-box-containing protein